MKGRIVFFIAVLLMGAGLTAYLVIEKPSPSLSATFAPAFQMLGRAPKTLDRALSKVVPADALDEKEYGEAIEARYRNGRNASDKESLYLNRLMGDIAVFRKKPFTYRVILIEMPGPNAGAMPGGVILVSRGLLALVKSESELASILAHEMGHVERSHCFDAVRFELAAGKVGSAPLGKLADYAVRGMLTHSFSKTQEDEADDYAYELIINTRYDPAAVGNAFMRLMDYTGESARGGEAGRGDMMRDYLRSHPPAILRYRKFREAANQWWLRNPREKRYCGSQNLQERVTFAQLPFDSEWVSREN